MATCDELATRLSGLQSQLAKLKAEIDDPEGTCTKLGLTGDDCEQYIKGLYGKKAAVEKEIAGVQQQQQAQGCLPPPPVAVNYPVLARNTDRRLALFALGGAGLYHNVYHLDQVAPGNGWSNWINFGYPPGISLDFAGNVVPLAIGTRDDGRLEVIAVDLEVSTFYHFVQAVPSDGWKQWEEFANAPWYDDDFVSSVPTLAAYANGQLALFEIPSDGNLYIRVQLPSPSDEWGGWTPHGSPATNKHLASLALPVAALNSEGKMEFFAVGSGGNLYHIWQTAPNATGGWSDWYSHGTPPGTLFYDLGETPLALAPSADGRLELFAVAADGNLYHISQVVPSGGWSNWISHGTPPGTKLNQTLALAPSADDRLELFALGQDDNLYHIWQIAPNGIWSDWYSHGTPPGTGLRGPTLALAPSVDGRLELFAGGGDGNLYHIWQVVPSPIPPNGWSPWFSHGHP